jgi:hypothetical protein
MRSITNTARKRVRQSPSSRISYAARGNTRPRITGAVKGVHTPLEPRTRARVSALPELPSTHDFTVVAAARFIVAVIPPVLATHGFAVFGLRGEPSVDQEIREPGANPGPPAKWVAGVQFDMTRILPQRREPASYAARRNTRARITGAVKGAMPVEVRDPCAPEPEPANRGLMEQRADCIPRIAPPRVHHRPSGRRCRLYLYGHSTARDSKAVGV